MRKKIILMISCLLTSLAFADTVEELRKKCYLGHEESCFTLGVSYYNANKETEAKRFYQISCFYGNSSSCLMAIGKNNHDNSKLSWVCRMNHGFACLLLAARLPKKDKKVKEVMEEAKAHFYNECNVLNNAQSCIQLNAIASMKEMAEIKKIAEKKKKIFEARKEPQVYDSVEKLPANEREEYTLGKNYYQKLPCAKNGLKNCILYGNELINKSQENEGIKVLKGVCLEGEKEVCRHVGEAQLDKGDVVDALMYLRLPYFFSP